MGLDTLSRRRAPWCAIALGLQVILNAMPVTAASADIGTAPHRIEAHSATLAAVGMVHEGRMTIHLSRVMDNSPVRDAVLTVLLRGVVHPTAAEADGSYTLQTKDLDLPGAAAVVFQIAHDGAREELAGSLQAAAGASKSEDRNSARQLGWWVLNFAVCIGFLMLIARRRKAGAPD